MIIRSDKVADMLSAESEELDPLVITPRPDISNLREQRTASIDLRLGTWMKTLRHTTQPVLDIYDEIDVPTEEEMTRSYYVAFGKRFVLHPRDYVLGVTLEWIRLPGNLAGYVIGKSKWGRRGMIVATATGVHPGFAGCLTLEISNLGTMPIMISPGMSICQLFLHKVDGGTSDPSPANLGGRRKPYLGTIRPDEIAMKLKHPDG